MEKQVSIRKSRMRNFMHRYSTGPHERHGKFWHYHLQTQIQLSYRILKDEGPELVCALTLAGKPDAVKEMWRQLNFYAQGIV